MKIVMTPEQFAEYKRFLQTVLSAYQQVGTKKMFRSGIKSKILRRGSVPGRVKFHPQYLAFAKAAAIEPPFNF